MQRFIFGQKRRETNETERKSVLTRMILEIIAKNRPKDVKQLVEAVHKQNSQFSKAAVLRRILDLEEERKIGLAKESLRKKGFLSWTIIGSTAITNVLVFTVSESSMLMPIRWVISYLFCVFVPGYCAVKVLFPGKELNVLESLILSIALSLAIIPLIGLVVNFLTGSIALPLIMFSLSLLVFTLSLRIYFEGG